MATSYNLPQHPCGTGHDTPRPVCERPQPNPVSPRRPPNLACCTSMESYYGLGRLSLGPGRVLGTSHPFGTTLLLTLGQLPPSDTSHCTTGTPATRIASPCRSSTSDGLLAPTVPKGVQLHPLASPELCPCPCCTRVTRSAFVEPSSSDPSFCPLRLLLFHPSFSPFGLSPSAQLPF